MQKKVRLSELRDISINFPGDFYVLAAWVLTNDLVWSSHQKNTYRRTTLNGLVGKYSMLNRENGDVEKLKLRLASAGLSLDATLEPDDQTANDDDHTLNQGLLSESTQLLISAAHHKPSGSL